MTSLMSLELSPTFLTEQIKRKYLFFNAKWLMILDKQHDFLFHISTLALIQVDIWQVFRKKSMMP